MSGAASLGNLPRTQTLNLENVELSLRRLSHHGSPLAPADRRSNGHGSLRSSAAAFSGHTDSNATQQEYYVEPPGLAHSSMASVVLASTCSTSSFKLARSLQEGK